MSKKNNRGKENNKTKIIIGIAAVLIVVLLVVLLFVLFGGKEDSNDWQELQSSDLAIEDSEGINGEKNGEDGVRELEEGENPEDIQVQVKTSADYVEPGEGTLDIDQIQGFTGAGQTANNSSNSSGGNNTNTDNKNSGNTGNDSNSENAGDNGNGENSDFDRVDGDAENSDNINGSQNAVLSDSNLTVNAVGSYTGNYLEDGSDTPISNVAAMLITNHSSQMLQIAQITFQVTDTETASFKVTNLPAGTSALVLEENGREYKESDNYSYGNTATAYIDPTLESDKFDITVSDGKVQLTNKTDQAYSKVYVYYKYVQLGGAYKGGITYRTPIENIPANGTAEAVAGHMKVDSTQIVNVQIVE